MAPSNVYTDYTLKTPIGFGASSIVYAATHSSSLPPAVKGVGGVASTTNSSVPFVCAVKVSSRHPDVGQWLEEVRLLSSCRHPNVLQIYAAFTIPPEHNQVAIVTPLISGGSLLSIMAWRATLPSDDQPSGLFRSLSGKHRSTLTQGRLVEDEIKAVLKQLLGGLGYLHSQGIIHRDIKAGNILVDSNGTILLADLGVGFRSTKDQSVESLGLVGSPCWMAPEIITGSPSAHKSDIWSLGITLIELSTGRTPFSDLISAKTMTQIAVTPAPSLPTAVDATKAYHSFLGLCLAKDPSARADVSHLERHSFLRNARKSAWLAETLLKGVPPLVHRQELRRVPSHHSLASFASSWNFNATPSVSVISSPVRTSHRLPRSPSASSAQSQILIPPTRHRRRSVSRSSTGYSVPPSPKASLSRASWMMMPTESLPRADEALGEGSGLRMKQSGSEAGRRRTTSLAPALFRQDITAEPLSRDTSPFLPSRILAEDLPSSSVPVAPSITSQSAETDSRPSTPPNSGEVGRDVIVVDSAKGASPLTSKEKERKGLFSRIWGMAHKEDGEDPKVMKAHRGIRNW